MKFTTTVTEKKNVEKEIELPFYSTSGNDYYKIISEDKCLNVWSLNEDAHISMRELKYCNEALTATPCSKLDFEIEYLKALNLITDNETEIKSTEEIMAGINA